MLPKLLDSDHDTPEAQPAADCQVDKQQAVGSKAQLTSGLPSDLYAIQHHHVSQAAEAHQDPLCARGRDLCSVRALKACNTTPLAAQPAGLTTAKSAATRQNPCDAATTATPTASHAAISSVVVPAPARATARPAYQTQADADAKAMGAKPASTHLTTAVDSATRMFSMSDVDANATKSALQPAGAASAAAESAGADSPAGSQPSPMQRPNSCKRRRVKRRLPGGCNVMPGILPNQPAGTQPGSVQRTVSSRRREKEKQRLAGAFSSMLGIMQACVSNDTCNTLASAILPSLALMVQCMVQCLVQCMSWHSLCRHVLWDGHCSHSIFVQCWLLCKGTPCSHWVLSVH